jgi:UDP-glucose:(heptosyl)LPS alpha-1,3-glucosyltransferase
MGTIYAAADALLLPAFYEASGLVVMEAMAAGLPVVSTRYLGVAELVEKNGVGVIVDSPRDVKGLAAGLEGLPGGGTSEHAAMRARARLAGTGVSAEGFLEEMERMYRELAEE